MDEKEDKKRKKRNIGFKEVTIFVLGLLPSIIFAISVVYTSNRDLEHFTISGGIAIIATAVSVWVGLNIYNMITKQEINGMIDNEIEERIENDLLKRIKESIVENAKQRFSVLLRSKEADEESSHFFLGLYNILGAETSNNTSFYGLPYEDAFQIENYWNICTDYYVENNWEKASKFGNLLCDKVTSIEKLNEGNLEKQAKLYLIFKEGDALFYKNASDNRNGEATKTIVSELKKCIDKYEEALKYMKENGDEANDSLRQYICNTIGYTYKLIGNEYSRQGKWEAALENNKEAIRYGLEAVKNDSSVGAYYNNLGLPYDWLYVNYDQVCEMKGKIQEIVEIIDEKHASAIVSKHKKIRKFFYNEAQKAYEQATATTKSHNKAFNNQGALILKELDSIYGVTGDRRELLTELVKGDKDNASGNMSALDMVKDAKRKLSIACDFDPYFEDSRYNYAKAVMYEYLITSDNSKKEEGMDAAKSVKVINKNNVGGQYVLRNWYEAVGDLDNAIDVNKGLLRRGDSENVMLLYLEEKIKHDELSKEEDKERIENLFYSAYKSAYEPEEIEEKIKNYFNE